MAMLAGTKVLAEGQRKTEKLDTIGAVIGTGAVVALT
jgi:hypothetical protein